MFEIGTHNVNGIRAAQRRGFTSWLAECQPDVLALQEVRCPVKQLPLDAFADYLVCYAPGQLAGRNGVALLTKYPVAAVRSWGSETFTITPEDGLRQLDPEQTVERSYTLAEQLNPFVEEGRYIEIDLADAPITIASLYLPKGGLPEELNVKPGRDGLIDPNNPARYARKMSFLEGFSAHLTSARENAATRGREFLIMGDFNVAHTKNDIRNWRGNQKSEGFLPEERAWFSSILGEETLTDVVRSLHPDIDGPYSWWSWMGQSFSKDVGWRIDYHLASPKLAQAAVAARVHKEADAASRMSDHSPVLVTYELD